MASGTTASGWNDEEISAFVSVRKNSVDRVGRRLEAAGETIGQRGQVNEAELLRRRLAGIPAAAQ